jgi:hypothetical protein
MRKGVGSFQDSIERKSSELIEYEPLGDPQKSFRSKQGEIRRMEMHSSLAAKPISITEKHVL